MLSGRPLSLLKSMMTYLWWFESLLSGLHLWNHFAGQKGLRELHDVVDYRFLEQKRKILLSHKIEARFTFWVREFTLALVWGNSFSKRLSRDKWVVLCLENLLKLSSARHLESRALEINFAPGALLHGCWRVDTPKGSQPILFRWVYLAPHNENIIVVGQPRFLDKVGVTLIKLPLICELGNRVDFCLVVRRN